MVTVWTIVVAVVAMLLLERLSISRLTQSPRGRQWIRRHKLLHPNTISFFRMPMGVLSVVAWMHGWHVFAFLWFSLWMISDLTDGTIARNCDLTTDSGKWLDPLSDKCMYFPILLFFAFFDDSVDVPRGWVAALLTIDAIGQFSRLLIKKKAANYFGKAKTALLTITITFLGLNQLEPLPFMSDNFVYFLTVSCTILAFLSFYCKAIPDSWYANSLTFLNFTCGLGAIWAVWDGHSLRAFVLIFVGQFFDLFDGRVARKYGSTAHGAFFDDIADGTSFGLAIGYLAFRGLSESMGLWGATTVVAFYVLCVGYRLYRFMHHQDQGELPPGTFQGLPSPAGAMLAGSSCLLFAAYLPSVAALLMVATSLLMVSHIRYRHFGKRIWPNLPNAVRMLLFVLLLVFVNMSVSDKNYSSSFSIFCFSMAILYLVIGTERAAGRQQGRVKGDPPTTSAAPSE